MLAGALIIAHGAMGFLWIVAPMSQREVIAAGGSTSADTMHLVLSGATGFFVAAYVATDAVAFGWAFWLYSIATVGTALLFGVLSAQVDRIEAGDATPYYGFARACRHRRLASMDGGVGHHVNAPAGPHHIVIRAQLRRKAGTPLWGEHTPWRLPCESLS